MSDKHETLPAVVEQQQPAELVGHAGKVATATRAIVEATAQNIQGRKYVRVEGWQAIAIAHGCVASSRDVERLDTGFRAIGEIRRRDTGSVIATAEGFVGDDERMWAGRHEYARRAMAQTRAISRACRSAFAHVVVMLNAGFETTPAEEIPPEPNDKPVTPRVVSAASHPSAAQIAGETERLEVSGTVERVVVKEGKTRGKKWKRWGILVGGEWYGTFDATLGTEAEALEGQPVRLAYERDGERNNALAIELGEIEATTDAVEPDYDDSEAAS